VLVLASGSIPFMRKFWRYCLVLSLAFYSLMPLVTSSATEDAGEDEVGVSVVSATHLYISAINPGYSMAGVSNFDDFIEIYNPTGEPFPLSGYTIVYNDRTIYTFANGSIMNSEYLLLRSSTSPNSGEADDTYSANLAVAAGRVSLVFEGEEMDSVCWSGEGCYSHFNLVATRTTTLRRCIVDGIVEKCANGLDFINELGYVPNYDPENPAIIYLPEEIVWPQCQGLRFSEIFTYYESSVQEQFIEFYNTTDEIIPLDGCNIFYKNRLYPMSGEVGEYEYFVYRNSSLTLTKNPTSSNVIHLVDADGTYADTLEYYRGQKRSTSLGYFGLDENGGEVWLLTYMITPGEENVYQQFRSCPVGKIINVNTGNCINFLTVQPLADCGPGRYRHPETNRCRNIVSAASAALAPCPEGYERNPETNRCRRIRQNDGANYGVAPVSFSDKSTFIAYGALSAIITTGILYVIFQFRQEIVKVVKKPFALLKR
jgi:hypothetical protein